MRGKLRHHAKFCGGRLNSCRGMAIFFDLSKLRPASSWIFKFGNFKGRVGQQGQVRHHAECCPTLRLNW